ncbi:hypothetical protein AB0I72_22860 [Nocardiopsis sp. NPDC049922]|uniref:hypothetical protein n=1 Tax=Nocardiopsis sp. NPDC049922 TaxID=3155157 RepID=UPI0033CA4493
MTRHQRSGAKARVAAAIRGRWVISAHDGGLVAQRQLCLPELTDDQRSRGMVNRIEAPSWDDLDHLLAEQARLADP